jgi:hypothetical protein
VIDLRNCKVSKIPDPDVLSENEHCFAISITEYKPASSTAKPGESGSQSYSLDMKPVAKHILCAESNADRDEWLKNICQEILKFRPRDWATLKQLSNIETSPGKVVSFQIDSKPASASSSPTHNSLLRDSSSSSFRKAPQLPPRSDSSSYAKISDESLKTPTPTSATNTDDQERIVAQDLPLLVKDLVGEILDVSDPSKMISNKARPSIWNYMNRKGMFIFLVMLGESPTKVKEVKASSHKIFGVPLSEAVGLSRISLVYPIPAVVYRCIEYLEYQKVWKEEGIYRLSGSSAEIAAMKARFDDGIILKC